MEVLKGENRRAEGKKAAGSRRRVRGNSLLRKQKRKESSREEREERSKGDRPGRLMVTTSPYNAGSVGLIPGQGARSLHALRPKKQNKT